jgi:peptide/nickel transport system substrate-binding protein
MSARQNQKFIVAIVLVAIIAVGGTYAVMSSMMAGTASTSTASVASSASTSARTGGTIVLEELCCLDSFDPAVASGSQGGEAIQAVYQGLLAYVPNSSEIVPLLATGYNVSSDGLTYTFQLRHNILFTNGDPVNSYVFWYSIYRAAIMAQFGSYLVTVALNTTGVTAAMLNEYTNATPPASLLQIMQNPNNALVAPDPYTLVFHLAHPFAAFLATLTQPEHMAVDPVVVSANGGVVAGQTNSWMSLNAVGNGPFMVQQYQPNNQLSLDRNPNYWGGFANVQPTPRVDRVIIKYVPNALTRMEDVQRGSAQIAYIDSPLVAQAVSAGGIYVPNIGRMPSVNVFGLDTQKFPFNNRLIRQAVVHAVNYSAMQQEFHGFGVSFVGPNPVGIGYNTNLQPYNYNLTLAKQLLVQAGYPGGQGIPTITILAATDSPPGPDVAVIVQSNLADIGINAKVMTETYSSELNLFSSTTPASSGYPDIIYSNWFWFPDPWCFANWYVGPIGFGTSNVAAYNTTVVNTLLDKADATVNVTARAAIYQQVAQVVYDDAPYIWVAQGKNTFTTGVPIVSTSVAGYVINQGFWETDFTSLYLTS